jgi:secreted PhoX family phosphatase
MGRFNHEAACVDPATGVVYQTEDRNDSLLYRFLPSERGNLAAGGKLQALAIDGMPDTRNWEAASFEPQSWQAVRWIDLDNVEAPEDDLRKRGAAAGATLFARGEGMWMGEGEFYFACTSGGAAKLGQIFRLRPRPSGEDRLQLFFESTDIAQFNYGDNLTVAPSGHLIVCEDAYSDTVANRLIGLTPDGDPYPLALLRVETEWAGACFSPDGKWLFVNAYKPTRTLAITGPW